MPANRVKLSSIQTLTFQNDKKTAHRRTSAIPQLKCKGPACSHYKPDVVQCYNMGGSGNDIQWRCEADLPEGMRLGGVEVSCEGWSKAGDEYVLKGSCGLEYRLVELPQYQATYGTPPSTAQTVQKYIFWLFFWAVAAWLAYKFATHILAPFFPSGVTSSFSGRRPPPGGGGGPWSWMPGFGGGPASGGGSGGGSGNNNPHDPPPPYAGYRPKPSPSSSSGAAGWNPGFWTGLGLGGAAAALYNSAGRRRSEYDWERERARAAAPTWWGGGLGGAPPAPRVYERVVVEERGPMAAGPSRPRRSGGDGDGGPQMRRSTGYGGSSVR